ncbi:tyrosine-type recombinase/integrase [Psychroflexus aestuariivivens]|uniref:tyrosine-type recombinase/integrase n=1 Tax=Psychroflexus aestuariivivens TaxID=1795040 RepID=UPI000FDB3B9F|nr:tyrosine-type recombinase/integrase [Psychroflexus aestuariivivens]
MSIFKFVEYLSHEKNYSKLTLKAYESDLIQFQNFLDIEFDNSNLEIANYSMIRQWIVELVNRDLENKSINRKISSLKTYYKFLLKVKVIESNPLAKHQVLKTPKRQQNAFSTKEVNQLNEIYTDETFEGLRDHVIIELLYMTGMRRQELIDLKLDDLDLAENQVRIHGKRNKQRLVPLLKSARNLLTKYISERSQVADKSCENLILTNKGKPAYPNLIHRVIQNYFSKISTKKKQSPHLLRHTFANHLLEKGADITAIKELLGHSSLASTQVYTQNSLKELTKAHSSAHPRSKINKK